MNYILLKDQQMKSEQKCIGTSDIDLQRNSFPSLRVQNYLFCIAKELKSLNKQIQFCCKRCGHRLFDYIEGEFTIELKCNKCKRVLLAQSVAYQNLIKGAENNKVTV